jgi:ubiquinone/menaquinone biosynthesis C-methylase UbiE
MSRADRYATITHNGERFLPTLEHYHAGMHLGHFAAYRAALPFCVGKRVLDVGCGTGYGAFLLASVAGGRVVGLEIDAPALAYAQETYPHSQLHFQVGDALALPFAPASFDFVFSAQVIEHVANPQAFLAEIRRVLSPNGLCLIATPNRQLFSPTSELLPTSTNPHHLNEMDWQTFHTVTQAIFATTRFAGIRQNALELPAGGGTPHLRPNQLIRPQDFAVQWENLDVCENMLCWAGNYLGKNQHDDFARSALVERVTAEQLPLWWDAHSKRWGVLGCAAGAVATQLHWQESLHWHGGDCVLSFTLPCGGCDTLELRFPRAFRAGLNIELYATHPSPTHPAQKPLANTQLRQGHLQARLHWHGEKLTANSVCHLRLTAQSALTGWWLLVLWRLKRWQAPQIFTFHPF